jgi:hypothetical protein
MNTQERMIDKSAFRIAVIAVAAAVLLAVAAYLFGTSLRADTSASETTSRTASLAALANSRSNFYADLNNSAAAAVRTASQAALAKSRADFYADLNNSAAAARSSAGLSTADYAAKSGVPAASVTIPESVGAKSSAADPYQYAWMGFTSPESVGASLSGDAASSADPSPWIKPEGIKATGAAGSATDGSPWIKPEGIKVSGAK